VWVKRWGQEKGACSYLPQPDSLPLENTPRGREVKRSSKTESYKGPPTVKGWFPDSVQVTVSLDLL
jgi:hypothetical protein